MKNKINKLMVLSAIAVGTLSLANAQWSVQDVNSNAMKGTLEDILDGIKTQITNQDALQSAQEIASRQSSIEVEENDRRNRRNAAQIDTIKRDRDAMPTLSRCVDLTRGTATAGGGSSVSRKGGGISSDKRKNEITDDEARGSSVVSNVGALGVCGDTEMEKHSRFCTAGASAKKFVGAVYSPRSILGNIEGSKDRSFKNLTLDADAQKAARKYIETATINNLPPSLDEKNIKKNESYIGEYYKIANGMESAYDAMIHANSVYNEMPINGAADSLDKVWKNFNPVFNALGMEIPRIPSLADIYTAEVNQDYYMLKPKAADATDGEVENLREINRKLSLNNFLVNRQISLQEYQTILLSHLVVRAYLPAADKLTKESRQTNSALK